MNKNILLEIIHKNGFRIVNKSDIDKKEFTGEELITKQTYSNGELIDIVMNIRQVKGFLESFVDIQNKILENWYNIEENL